MATTTASPDARPFWANLFGMLAENGEMEQGGDMPLPEAEIVKFCQIALQGQTLPT
jgi:hypothetical protein